LMAWTINCAAVKPLKATGTPVGFGFMNPEGDPNGTFPEFTTATKAAVDYVNNTLGGLGADLKAGKPGRPIKLDVCTMAISPTESLKCANQLASDKNFLNISTLDFFGNNIPVLKATGAPLFVVTPITVPDNTTPGIFAIGNGGGCVGVHPGLVQFTTKDLGAKHIAIPWADTPPGVVCYYDLEKKPVDILAGTVDGPAGIKGSIPGLTELGVAIKPAQPDITPQASQVLAYKPDAIIFSGQNSDCWSLVNTLGKLGWTAAKIPLVLSGACIDTTQAKAAGAAANGIYFVGSPPFTSPDLLDGVLKLESQTYLSVMDKADKADESKGFAVQGFQAIMQLFSFTNAAASTNGGIDSVTGAQLSAYMAATHAVHSFGGTPLGCADAVAPYSAVCGNSVAAFQWTGSGYTVKEANFTGVPIIAGTKIDTGPPGAS